MADENVSLLISAPADDAQLQELIRKRIAEPPRRPLWDRICRHPLTSVVVGFLLTGAIGTMLTDRINRDRLERDHAIQQERVRLENAVRSADEFLVHTREQHVRAELLLAAMSARVAPEQLRARQQAYEDAYVRWNRSLSAYTLALENIREEDSGYPFREIHASLVALYQELERGLDLASLQQLRGDDGGDVAFAATLLSTGDRCTAEFSRALRGYLNRNLDGPGPARGEPSLLLRMLAGGEGPPVPLGVEETVLDDVGAACRSGGAASPAGSAARVVDQTAMGG